MDREAVVKKLKMMKSKAKAARKAGKRDQALTFKYSMQRLQRTLNASEVKVRKKKSEMTEAAPVPGATLAPKTDAPAAA